MKAKKILFDKGNVRLADVSLPEPKENEVLIQVKYSLISNGTEKACLMGEENSTNIPMRFGYSSVGYIIQTGKKVKNFHVGDRVYANYVGHASYGIRPVSSVWKIPDNVTFEDAVFTKIASFPLLALRRARLEAGESVAIVGTGMLGLLGVQLANIFGAMPVIAVGGSRQDRLEKAKNFGADFVLTANDSALTQKIMDISQAHTLYKGINVVIETSGTESALHSALKYIARNGRLVLNGCNRVTRDPINFYQDIHVKGVSLIGANNSNHPSHNSYPGNWTIARDYTTLLQWMSFDRLHPRDLISEIASPQDCVSVFDRLLHDREFPLGVLFDWSEFHN